MMSAATNTIKAKDVQKKESIEVSNRFGALEEDEEDIDSDNIVMSLNDLLEQTKKFAEARADHKGRQKEAKKEKRMKKSKNLIGKFQGCSDIECECGNEADSGDGGGGSSVKDDKQSEHEQDELNIEQYTPIHTPPKTLLYTTPDPATTTTKTTETRPNVSSCSSEYDTSSVRTNSLDDSTDKADITETIAESIMRQIRILQ